MVASIVNLYLPTLISTIAYTEPLANCYYLFSISNALLHLFYYLFFLVKGQVLTNFQLLVTNTDLLLVRFMHLLVINMVSFLSA